eukprot:scaffold3074_cov143-Pinguiococcus_pyrenoidosus.AAC.1
MKPRTAWEERLLSGSCSECLVAVGDARTLRSNACLRQHGWNSAKHRKLLSIRCEPGWKINDI